MGRIEKTVFVSYRRTDEPWGLAIFQHLTQHGYDVFIDYEGIGSGNFGTIILENIRARAHFLVLLTPTALKRCGDPKDWMRREIEAALDSQRNIVPLMLEGFDFSTPAIANQLTGRLAALKEKNALEIPRARFFLSEMERLRNSFLNVPVDAVLHPASDSAQQVAKEQKDKATGALVVENRKGEDAQSAEGQQIQNQRGKQVERVPRWKEFEPRFVAKFTKDKPKRDRENCYEIRFGVHGFPSGTRQIVFFTDHPDSLEGGRSLEEALCTVVIVMPQRRLAFVDEEEAWDIDGDFWLYAVGVFGDGRTFTLSTMLCDALDAHYSAAFPEGVPERFTKAISDLRATRD
jgi:hypothetical protein